MRQRILVVDDTPDTLSFLVRLLESGGYQVSSAETGVAGLAAAEDSPPDLVILDLRLEDMHGLEVCRQLKARAETKDVPIILISGMAETDEWVGGLELGAADYVTKPFRNAELLARVKTQLALGRTLAQLKEKNALVQRANERLEGEVMARLKTENELLRSLDRAERSRRALLSALEDEREVQEEMNRARNFLDSIIENIPSMMVLRDAKDLRVVRINRAGEELLGRPRSEILGKTAFDLFPRAHAELYVAKDRETLARGCVVDIEEEPQVTADGGERILHTKKVPVLGSQSVPEYLLSISVDITETKRAQDAIKNLSSRLDHLLGAVPEILMEVDANRVYTWANDAGKRFFGDDVLGRSADHYFVGEQQTANAVQPLFNGNDDAVYVESLQRRRDGVPRLLAWSCRPLRDADGRVKGALSSARDITEFRKIEEERRKLEEQVRASQKMEAIGSLAGGVAHDFNNLLCVLQSYTDFAIKGVRADDPVREDLLAVKRAGERAAALTRQLLAFGRRQVMQPVPLNLNDVAANMEKMLRRILGEDIVFEQALAPDLGVVRADPGQIEQVLMNLVVNARDAMPEGGRLSIETKNIGIEDGFLEVLAPLDAGPYVQIAVSDTGSGMDEQTMGRIFDPFFTTKEKGRGTGLGLSTVYGIVKQSKGGLWVASEVGRGTTFKVYLPRELEAVAVAVRADSRRPKAGGTETVLVVEDEDDLRRVAWRALAETGYNVLSAADGEEALRVAEEYAGEIHLLLTDVVMPKVGGRALAHKLRRKRPTTAILYMSGYADDAILRHGLQEPGIQFLPKPFTVSSLTHKVREVLDRDKPESEMDDEPSGSISTKASSQELQRERLSENDLAALHVVTMTARYDELMQAIDKLRASAPTLARKLQEYAERFDYEAILSKLERFKSGGET